MSRSLVFRIEFKLERAHTGPPRAEGRFLPMAVDSGGRVRRRCQTVRKCTLLSVDVGMNEHRAGDPDSEAIGRRVQEELARRRMSRQALADSARISLPTLEKALAGKRPFTLATIIRLEEALGTALRCGWWLVLLIRPLEPRRHWLAKTWAPMHGPPCVGWKGAISPCARVLARLAPSSPTSPPFAGSTRQSISAMPKLNVSMPVSNRTGMSPCPIYPIISIWSPTSPANIG